MRSIDQFEFWFQIRINYAPNQKTMNICDDFDYIYKKSKINTSSFKKVSNYKKMKICDHLEFLYQKSALIS